MISNDIFYSNTQISHQCNCEICKIPVAFFISQYCRFYPYKDQWKKSRPKEIYMDCGVFILCSERCLKEWCDKNVQLLEDECKNNIPEDNPDKDDHGYDLDEDDDDND
jgi:hypothetical protein